MTSFGFPKQFDKNVSSVIAKFVTPVPKRFLDWVETDKLDWYCVCKWVDDSILFDYKDNLTEEQLYSICENENAIFFIEDRIENKTRNKLQRKQLSVIDWSLLSSNKNAIHILKKHRDQIFLHRLCLNENAIQWLSELTNNFTENMHRIDWTNFCKNKNAIPILERLIKENPKISKDLNWIQLSANPNAISLLENDYKSINFASLCKNPNAIPFLEKITNNFTKNMELIHWYNLTSNPNAVPILEKHWLQPNSNLPDKISWDELCENPNAVNFVYQLTNSFTIRLHKMKWGSFWCNSNALPLLLHHNKTPYYHNLSWNNGIIEIDKKRYKSWLDHITKFVYHL